MNKSFKRILIIILIPIAWLALFIGAISIPKIISIFYDIEYSIGLRESISDLTTKAIKENNPKLCMKIAQTYSENSAAGFPGLTDDDRMDCLSKVASTNHNMQACLMRGFDEDCLVKNSISPETDYKLCGSFPNKFMAQCYANFAIKLNNPSICTNVKDEAIQDQCLYVRSLLLENSNLKAR